MRGTKTVTIEYEDGGILLLTGVTIIDFNSDGGIEMLYLYREPQPFWLSLRGIECVSVRSNGGVK